MQHLNSEEDHSYEEYQGAAGPKAVENIFVVQLGAGQVSSRELFQSWERFIELHGKTIGSRRSIMRQGKQQCPDCNVHQGLDGGLMRTWAFEPG
jgi:hypothetical protein